MMGNVKVYSLNTLTDYSGDYKELEDLLRSGYTVERVDAQNNLLVYILRKGE